MTLHAARAISLVSLLLMVFCTRSTTLDNRFFYISPEWYFSRTSCERSAIAPYLSLYTANGAYQEDDTGIGIPEIFGSFDQQKLNSAIVEKDGINFIQQAITDGMLPQTIEKVPLPWSIDGKIEGQGVNFFYEQYLFRYFSLGFTTAFMHVFSRQNFFSKDDVVNRLNPTQLQSLDVVRRNMFKQLGLESSKWSATGLSDIDVYARCGNVWDYVLKCRKIDAGIRFGVLIPTGVKRDPRNPASIPFGGNGHTGLYLNVDAEFELKEDLKVGFFFRYIGRLPRNTSMRIPIAGEQPLFAALLTNVRVHVGETLIFSPYIEMDGLRDGFGIAARYIFVWHEEDSIKTLEGGTAGLRGFFGQLRKTTGWTGERVTAKFFYDFSAVGEPRRFAPEVALIWDVPVKFWAAEGVSKTNRISLGFCWKF
jgi:hypothetical protein